MGESVQTVGEAAFRSCTSLTSITIPNSVTNIGKRAFEKCIGLTSVTIGNSVSTIGEEAFHSCTGLTSIKFGNSVETIENSAFYGCTDLASIVFPNSLTSIGDCAFYGCSSLPYIIISEGVTSIGASAFGACSSATSITIPNSVLSIGDLAFAGLESLTKVYSWMYSPCDINNHKVFSGYKVSSCTLYIPNSSLRSVYLNAGYNFGGYNGYNCFGSHGLLSSLSFITFADANVNSLCVANWDTNGDGWLSSKEAAAVTDLGTVFEENTTITSFDELQYFTGLTNFGNGAFSGCSGLTSITIPENVTSIGEHAFLGCSGLQQISVGSNNPIYDSRGGCNAIIETSSNTLIVVCKSTVIPNSVTSIGEYAFSDCSSLTSITIPESVMGIGDHAFAECANLTSVVAEMKTPFGNSAFSGINSSCVLTVPYGTRDAYIAAGWTEDVFKGGVVEAQAPTILATSIALDYETLVLTSENETTTLTATVEPADVTDGSVTWTSSDETVAAVSSEGVITAVANGTAIITATTNDGTNLIAQCRVTVELDEPAGTDLSYLIQNPRFEGIDSDKMVPYWEGTPLTATLVPQAEMFNKNFDFYQDIESSSIKAGIYDVSVQAFYRTAANADAWAAYQSDPEMTGEAQVHSYIYLNEFATPVKNVMEISYDTNLANNCYARSDGRYTLDGMASAAVAFAYQDEVKNFTQHTYGLITEEEAGHIRLGIRNTTGTNNSRWTLFGNFGLRYMGKDAVALKSVIGNYLQRHSSLDMTEYSTQDFAAWNTAREATEGYETMPADANGESEELFTILTNLAQAYNHLAVSKQACIDLEAALAKCESYLNAHTVGPDVANEVAGWCADVRNQTGISNFGSGTVAPIGSAEQYQELIDLAVDYYDMLVNSGIDLATLPADLTDYIINADYSEGTQVGWNGSNPAAGYGAVEFYDGVFNHYQTIHVPRDGYYLLTVRAFDRIGSASNDYRIYYTGTYAENVQTVMYANVGEDIFEENICYLMSYTLNEEDRLSWSISQTTPYPWNHISENGVNKYTPNNMEAAAAMFLWYKNTESGNVEQDPVTGENVILDETAGYYYNSLLFYAPKGDVTIGLNKKSNISSSWCIWTDWKLWYYGEEEPTEHLATGISLNQEELTLTAMGETATLTATVEPANVTDGSVTWASSDETVATVSSEGVVTAVANGTTIITATTNDGTNLTATCTVTVSISEEPIVEPDTDISQYDNVVYMERVEARAGTEQTLSIRMKNTEGIQTVQFDFYLPEGVEVLKDEDDYELIELSLERTTARKMDSFSVQQLSSGAYRVLINSTRGNTFDGEDGEIATAQVRLSSDMEAGDYPIIFRDIVLVNTSTVGYETTYVKCTLNVPDYTPGDVNDDGKVNAIDLNAITNYILERRTFPFTFNTKAADLNDDGNINAIDLNMVTNMILHESTASGAKRRAVLAGIIED